MIKCLLLCWSQVGGLRNYHYEYNIPNIISNSHINTQLLYTRTLNDSTFVKQIKVNRPFYSSLARWAGGVSIAQQSEHRIISFPKLSAPVAQYMKYNTQDYWGALAFKVGHKENTPAISFFRVDIIGLNIWNVPYPNMTLITFMQRKIYTCWA